MTLGNFLAGESVFVILEPMAYIYGSEAYSPREVARRVENIGVAKATAPFIESLMLGILAGGFVGLGGLYSTMVLADSEMSFAAVRILAGFAFAIGYVVAILSGAEVFTSNNLLAMTWAARKISTWQLLRHWNLILMANGIGALGLILLFVFSGLPVHYDQLLGKAALEIAVKKISLPLTQVFFLAILGNLFVCISVWIAMAGKSVSDKVISMILPLSALGALELEHVLATLYFLPRAMVTMLVYPEIDIPGTEAITIGAFLANLLVVTLGNIVGGTFMVTLVYHLVYRHNPRRHD